MAMLLASDAGAGVTGTAIQCGRRHVPLLIALE